MSVFDEVVEMIDRLSGYEITHMAHQVMDSGDSLSIGLTFGPSRRDVVLVFGELCYFSFSKEPQDAGPLILDVVTAQVLAPTLQPWPPPLQIGLNRSQSFPWLV